MYLGFCGIAVHFGSCDLVSITPGKEERRPSRYVRVALRCKIAPYGGTGVEMLFCQYPITWRDKVFRIVHRRMGFLFSNVQRVTWELLISTFSLCRAHCADEQRIYSASHAIATQAADLQCCLKQKEGDVYQISPPEARRFLQ
jgi:hypothetical protein